MILGKHPLALLPALLFAATVSASTVSVRDTGATGDGKTLDTDAVNKAIDQVAASGGGTVEFPAGTYLCYSIHLKSHITLQLDNGCIIKAAEAAADGSVGYDDAEPSKFDLFQDFGHNHWHNSLIWGEDLTDIAIYGPGEIFGYGLSRGAYKYTRDLLPEERASHAKQPEALNLARKEDLKTGPFGYPSAHDTLAAKVGNKAIALKNCHNVIFRDFTIYHGGHFAILGTAVDNWTVSGLKIDTNRDGIDIDDCNNVRVSDCSVNSPYDDGICPKSSYGLGYNRPTENITITNCFVSGFDEGTMLDGTRQTAIVKEPTGRIKCGTESNGGFRNITISNCVFEHCRGFALESVDGALMEDITVDNLAMRDICNAPIYIRLGARDRGPDAKPGTARRIKISNVVAHDVAAQSGILISGLTNDPIEDLTLSNIFIDYKGGGTKAQGERVVEEDETEYPEPSRMKTIPAWGLWARHVANFTVDHIELRAQTTDDRPAVNLVDVKDGTIERSKIVQNSKEPAVWLEGTSNFSLTGCPGLPDTVKPATTASERF